MAEMNHSTFLWQGTDASAQENEAGVSDAQKFITLKPGGKKLEYPEKAASLLEALEYHGIAVEYQCRSGYCGSCRCRMTAGKVTYRQEPLALVNEGEILPCCCIPECEIELDIENVR